MHHLNCAGWLRQGSAGGGRKNPQAEAFPRPSGYHARVYSGAPAAPSRLRIPLDLRGFSPRAASPPKPGRPGADEVSVSPDRLRNCPLAPPPERWPATSRASAPPRPCRDCATGRIAPDSETSRIDGVGGERRITSNDTSAAAAARSAAGPLDAEAAGDVEVDIAPAEITPQLGLQHRQQHREPALVAADDARRGVPSVLGATSA